MPGGPHGPGELHGTAVSVQGRGLLILGPSGSGKSRLAVEMMSLGAELVADDRVAIMPGARPVLAAPGRWPGLIEVRGLGLIRAPSAPPAPCHAAVDLGEEGGGRLPEHGTIAVGGVDVTCLRWGEGRPYAAALMLYLRCNCEGS